MINVRHGTHADFAAWDQFVTAHPERSPYHLSAWCQAVAGAYRHQCIFLLAESDGTLAGILPLVKMGLPLLPKQYCSLPFCDLGGILATSGEARDALLKAAFDLAGSASIDLRNSAEHHSNPDQFGELEGQKVRMLLPLPASADDLMANFKAKLRSQVRKAEKNGMSFRFANTGHGGEQDLAAFYEVMQINMRQLGSPVHSQRWYQQILHHYGERARLGLVEYEGKIVGGAVILLCGHSVTVPWASTNPEFNRLAPNMLLYWGILGFAADNGFSYFDFGRSTVGEGTYRFKKQWGAKPVPLDWTLYRAGQLAPPSSVTASAGSKNNGLRDKIAQIWSQLPPGLTNTIGPLLRRYISL